MVYLSNWKRNVNDKIQGRGRIEIIGGLPSPTKFEDPVPEL